MRAVCSLSIRRSARSPWLTVSRKSKMDSRRIPHLPYCPAATAAAVTFTLAATVAAAKIRCLAISFVPRSAITLARGRCPRDRRLSPGGSSLGAGTYLTRLVAIPSLRDSAESRGVRNARIWRPVLPTSLRRLRADRVVESPTDAPESRWGKLADISDSASQNTVATTARWFLYNACFLKSLCHEVASRFCWSNPSIARFDGVLGENR